MLKHTLVLLTGIAFLFPSKALLQNPGAEQLSPRQHQPDENGEAEHISDHELKQYAKAAEGTEKVRANSNEKMEELIEKYGMTLTEFREKERMAEDPSRKHLLSDEEIRSLKLFKDEISEIQREVNQQMQQKIENSGLSMQQYYHISSRLQRDEAMLEKVHQYMEAHKIEVD